MDNTVALQAFSYPCCPGTLLGSTTSASIPHDAKPRFCDCGGRLRYRDARKYSIPGVPVGAHRWVCEGCGAVRTRWQASSREENERERAQSRRASAAFRRRVRALIAEAKDKPCA